MINKIIDSIYLLNEEVEKYLSNSYEFIYPAGLIEQMKAMGCFGLTIPKKFGGGALMPTDIKEVMLELSKKWLSLTALLGTHYRVAQYFISCASQEQQDYFLPRMADGRLIGAHAFHEQGKKQPVTFSTTLTKEGNRYYLNGTKNWVTNAENADFILVIAKITNEESDNVAKAIIVYRNKTGINISKNLIRPGIKGISLNQISFKNYEIDPYNDLLGGINTTVDSFINDYRPNSSLSFAARCMGAASTVYEDCKKHLEEIGNRGIGQEVVNYQFGKLSTKYLIAKSVLDSAFDNINDHPDPIEYSHMVKIFCSNLLQEIIQEAMLLQGGSGYADTNNTLERIYRDAISILLIDTPNDILYSRIGYSLLNKKYNCES